MAARRAWIVFGDGGCEREEVWVWDHTMEAAVGSARREVEARRGVPTRKLPLLLFLSELAERGEAVLFLGWSGRLTLQPARLLLEALRERGAIGELDYAEWLKSKLFPSGRR